MRADKPETETKEQYHIGLKPGDIPPYVLLPGDPKRTELISGLWDQRVFVADRRQFRTYRGKYKGADIAVVSSGIGPSAIEIALIELINVGAHTFIRVGSSGALRKNVEVGDVVISYAAMRLDGTSGKYAPYSYPAVSNLEVTLALIEAAESLNVKYHVGITASTDSFYVGQERPTINDFLPRDYVGFIDELRKLNVVNFEMEMSTLFVLSNIFNVRAGGICAVFANRETNKFEKRGEDTAAIVASEAVKILQEWDQDRGDKPIHRFHLPRRLK
ncbi:MAG: uridine phosphorylase [Candidatus Njordarchaeia archaeon]